MKIVHKGSDNWKYLARLILGIEYFLVAIGVAILAITIIAGIYFFARLAWAILNIAANAVYLVGGSILTLLAGAFPSFLAHWPTFTIIALVIAILFLLFWPLPDEDEYGSAPMFSSVKGPRLNCGDPDCRGCNRNGFFIPPTKATPTTPLLYPKNGDRIRVIKAITRPELVGYNGVIESVGTNVIRVFLPGVGAHFVETSKWAEWIKII